MEQLKKENKQLQKQVKLLSKLLCDLSEMLMQSGKVNTTANLLSEHISDLYVIVEALDARMECLELLNVSGEE